MRMHSPFCLFYDINLQSNATLHDIVVHKVTIADVEVASIDNLKPHMLVEIDRWVGTIDK